MNFVDINETTTIKQGDTTRTFTAVLHDENNAPANLTNATVRLILAPKGKEAVLNKLISIVDAVNGEVSFSFDSEDITGSGYLDAEFRVTYTNGDQESFPTNDYKKIKIYPNLLSRGETNIPPSLIEQYQQTIDGQSALIQENTNKVDVLSDEKADEYKVEDIKHKGKNLIQNADFEKMPNIQSRSSVYSFQDGVTSPNYKDKKSFKITSSGYESSSDTSKDFAFILGERILINERVKVEFMAYPSQSSKDVLIRMAYTSGVVVNMGEANKWNKISVELDLSSMTEINNYLYFNLNSSFTLYISDLRVENISSVNSISVPESFVQSNQKISNLPTSIHQSDGIIDVLLMNAHTYWEKASTFSYGNLYTAYDKSVQLTDGKNQIDCSSFANLMIHGVPYENSRYNNNVQNKDSKHFYKDVDGYKFRYANQIAKYAFDNGFAFKPNADFSNLEAGDILFFSWNNGVGGDLENGVREHAFMMIDHVAVFLNKKNESYWSTVQFDNNISTVYYDATNEYMSQCVLAARFPFSDSSRIYDTGNILYEGDTPKNVSNAITISSYKLSKNLKKGRYYTFFVDGNITTPNCYFLIQVNGKTVYSDNGKVGEYKGITRLGFTYLLDDVSDTITLLIGAGAGVDSNRSATVSWCSLYEGFVKTRKSYNPPFQNTNIKQFPLSSGLASDLDNGFVPYYKYSVEGNKILYNISLPFNTTRTGTLILGNIGTDAPKNTKRVGINLVGVNGEAIIAQLQFKWDGEVSVIPYSQTVQWKKALKDGLVFRE